MHIHDLKPAAGANKKRKRVARGIAGKGGKTAGRGHKGQGARGSVNPRFEGGQTPIHRRTPKAKGFNNPFRIEYQAINLDALEQFDSGSVVDLAALRASGLVHKHGFVKILGRGELTKSLTVHAHGFSASAARAIEAAGGRAETLPAPYGGRRPPAKGNALTNR
jgi:large subunit ribosomal protein L15